MAQIGQGGCAISMPVYKTKDFSASSWVKTWGTWSDPSWTCCEQEVGLEVLWTPFQPELFSYSVVLHGSQVAIAPLGMVVGQDVHLCPRNCLLEKLATIPCSLFAKKKGCGTSKNLTLPFIMWYISGVRDISESIATALSWLGYVL